MVSLHTHTHTHTHTLSLSLSLAPLLLQFCVHADSERILPDGIDLVDVTAPAFSTFNVTYLGEDRAGNQADNITRVVTIVDTIPPTLRLLGANAVYCLIDDYYCCLCFL